MNKKCFFRSTDDPICKKPIVVEIKVRIFHSDTERKTTKIFFLCQEHFEMFQEDPYWIVWYSDNRDDAYVTDILNVIYLGENTKLNQFIRE